MRMHNRKRCVLCKKDVCAESPVLCAACIKLVVKKKLAVQIYCDCTRGKASGHVYVSSSLDPRAREDDSWKDSCRPVRPDYRTTACLTCGLVSTGDFATD
jgi:hypothetical protein